MYGKVDVVPVVDVMFEAPSIKDVVLELHLYCFINMVLKIVYEL